MFNSIMELPIIRTYSRKHPVTTFKSAATLAPNYPDSKKISNVRESQLQNKTLIVNAFDNTFDRLANEIILKPRTNLIIDSKCSEISCHEEKSLKKNYSNESNEILEFNEQIYNPEKQKENNDNMTIKIRTGIKRKIQFTEDNDDLDTNSFKNVNEHNIKTYINKKKRVLIVDEKKLISNESIDLLQKHHSMNTQEHKFIQNLPTSTPREHKMQINVDMQYLSPILLKKDYNKQHSKLSTTTYNNSLENRTEIKRPQDEKIENRGHNSKNKFSEVKMPKCNTQIENQIPLNEIEKVHLSKSIADTVLSMKVNVTSAKSTKKKKKSVSFADSPLIFDDTDYYKHKSYNDKMIALNNVEKNSENISLKLFRDSVKANKKLNVPDFNLEPTNNENANFNSLQNDSPFSLHEWTDEYNSSYEYLSQIENKNEKLINFESNEHIKTNMEELSIESKNDCTQSTANNNVQNKIEISDTENELLDKRNKNFNDVISNLNKIFNENEILNENNRQWVISLKNSNQKQKVQTNQIIKSKEIKRNLYKNNEFSTDEEHLSNDENVFLSNLNSINNSSNATHSINTLEQNKNIFVKTNIEEHIASILNTVDNNVENESTLMINDGIHGFIQFEINEAATDDEIFNKQDKIHKDINIKIITKKNNLDKNDDQTDKKKIYNKDTDKKLNFKTPVVNITRLVENVKIKKPILSVKKTYTKRSRIKNHINLKTKKFLTNFKLADKIEMKSQMKDIVKSKLCETENSRTDFSDIRKVDSIITQKAEQTILVKKFIIETQKINKNKEPIVLISKLEDLDKKYKSYVFSKNNSKQEIKTNVINIDNSVNDNNGFSPKQTTLNKSKSMKFKEMDILNSNFQNKESFSSKLNNSNKIPKRSQASETWNKPLTAITEDFLEESTIIDEENNTKNKSINTNKINSQNNDINLNVMVKEFKLNRRKSDDRSASIVLKPGKSWARSLSIINNFHNVKNLDEFAIGRGKNWRHSVQTILNMQPKGVVQNINRVKNDEKEFLSHSFTVSDVIKKDKNSRFTSIMDNSHLSHGFSMRIIPSGKRSTFTDDFTDIQRIIDVSGRRNKTSIARKMSIRFRRKTLIKTEDDLIRSAKDIILSRCNQKSYIPFKDCFPDSYINCCRKIGEGVYGEVFLYENSNKKSVIKIIPIEGEKLINCERQKKFHEILSEIIISQELHKLKFGEVYNTDGFVGVNKIMCIIGSYPKKLIDLWKRYDIEKKSENDCPSIFNNQQLYIVLELAHGGQDLEAYTFQNALESHSIFVQTAFSLAVAEKSLKFEHRDLHWGNILISDTDKTDSIIKFDGTIISLPTKGVKVSLIDFTLSRMSYQGCKIFNDLATDSTLFTAQGEYQFDIYRMMKDHINNDWQQFKPYTNVLWLDYILDKIINAVRYKKKTSKIHKNIIKEMKALRKEILNYESAFDFVKNCKKIKTIINNNGNHL